MSALMDQHQRWMQARASMVMAARAYIARPSPKPKHWSWAPAPLPTIPDDVRLRLAQAAKIIMSMDGIGHARLGHGDITDVEKAVIDPMFGIRLILSKHQVSLVEVQGRARAARIVAARRESAHFLHEIHGWSTPKIGRWMGGRDHSTILNLLRPGRGALQ